MNVLAKIQAAVDAAAPNDGAGILSAGQAADPAWDVTTRADGLRVKIDFRTAATAQQRQAARQAVMLADLTPTTADLLDDASVSLTSIKALLLRESPTQWALLSAGRKQDVQRVIDDAASALAAALA